MSKRGLPTGMKMRHDQHYVEEISKKQRTIGRLIPIEKILPNPAQPRTEIGDLTDLAASIREKGVLEPLLVKPLDEREGWLVIAGERRWRAAQLVGLSEVPCIELDIDETQVAEIALIENLQRKDLTVWEEADGLASLSQRFGYTHEEIARRIGKSRSSVTESLTIASLPDEVRQRCVAANLNSKSAVLQIARQFDEKAMLDAVAKTKKPSQRGANGKPQDRVEDKRSGEGNKQGVAISARKTGLSFPLKIYSYQPSGGEFKLDLRFKKPVDKEELVKALREVLGELEAGSA